MVEFTNATETRLAVWTTSATPHGLLLPLPGGRYAVTSHTGEALPAIVSDAKGLSITLADSPQYLVHEKRE